MADCEENNLDSGEVNDGVKNEEPENDAEPGENIAKKKKKKKKKKGSQTFQSGLG